MTRRRRRGLRLATAAIGVAVLGGGVAVAATVAQHAGPQGDATGVTPVGFTVTPAGTQTALGDLPLASALSPDGRTLLVSNDGQGTQSLQVVDVASGRVVQTIPYATPRALFVGLAWSPDGRTVYAGGGGESDVHTYAVTEGGLVEGAPIPVPVPAGSTAATAFPAGLAVTPDGKRLLVADHLTGSASLVDLASGGVSTVSVGPDPWQVAISPDGHTGYVSNQGANTVSVLDLSTGTPAVRSTVTVGQHPNAVLLDREGKRLYVSDAESDRVDVVDTARAAVTSSIDLSPYRGAGSGTSPVALALAPDGARLYVADAGNNDVAVVDLAHGKVTGLVPTAWYPTSVAATADRLLVTNGKGLGAGPNNGPGHPDPYSSAQPAENQYVGSMMTGSLSAVALPLDRDRLQRYTQQVALDDGFAQRGSNARPQPIQHVIYVVQENRTYDQVLGSLGKGNGDPSLTLFGDESAPNQRQLQNRFVTLDNFYADAEISAQGWDWTTQAGTTLYNESLWPANYSSRKAPYPSENGDPAHAVNPNPADSYIWDRLADAGVSFRNYGFYVNENADHSFTATDPRLDAGTDHAFRGFDLACPDNPDTFTPLKSTCGTPRITEWENEFQAYETSGSLPTVEFVRLPNDHNAGTKPGSPTPRAYVADNDLALGRLVDAVSHSKFWSSTAIFVTEDDAQDGPDHVDAHRTISQVISPYTQSGAVDSTFYSTASMLRSIENIVGIAPLTQFDAFATPMTAAFTARADGTPWTAVRPAEAGNSTNGATAPMAAQAAAQPLAEEDQIDMRTFNEEIWASVKGSHTPMPAPQHLAGAPPAAAARSVDDDD